MNCSKFLSKYFYLLFIAAFFQSSCLANHLTAQERKTFIVTGASGELGGATARLLAQDDNLILTGRDLGKLESLREELQATNSGHYEVGSLDFVSHASRENFNHYLKLRGLQITGVVLIAPRPQFYGKALLQSEDVWLEVFQNTFTGPLEALRVILPYLSNPSKIVVISGTTSVQLQPEYGPSCVIRRMWTTYTKALSHQLGPQGISVNALSPGVVLTTFHEERIQKKAGDNGVSYQEQMEKEVANIPLQRHAKPQEVAQAIKFLLTEQSDFINGVNLILDGGFTVSY